MQSIVDFLYMVDDMLWGTPMVVIVLGTGIFLSLRFGFSYQRKLKFNIKNTFGNMTAAGEGVGTVSSFRAACTGLANTVGTGNISGVATAIVSGRPGRTCLDVGFRIFRGCLQRHAKSFLVSAIESITKTLWMNMSATVPSS